MILGGRHKCITPELVGIRWFLTTQINIKLRGISVTPTITISLEETPLPSTSVGKYGLICKKNLKTKKHELLRALVTLDFCSIPWTDRQDTPGRQIIEIYSIRGVPPKNEAYFFMIS